MTYLRLMRPANIVTSVADVIVGFAASGVAFSIVTIPELHVKFNYTPGLLYLLGASACLYGGGVVLNDYFDAALDRKERPERPIPSGKASEFEAMMLGSTLAASGIALASKVSVISSLIALSIAVLAVLYNKYTKHTAWGPLNMGACRAFNLMLGMSIAPEAIVALWFLLFIPVVYIGAITVISRGEVHGAGRKTIENGFLLYVLMLLGVFHLMLLERFTMVYCLPFLVLFMIVTLPPLIMALKNPDPVRVRRAVKRSILALILLDASLAGGFAGYETGIAVLLLLPVSIALAKRFAVT